jgi:hypothetical protein
MYVSFLTIISFPSIDKPMESDPTNDFLLTSKIIADNATNRANFITSVMLVSKSGVYYYDRINPLPPPH